MTSTFTRIAENEYKFTLYWAVENVYESIAKKEDQILSPVYTQGPNNERKWFLSIDPKAKEHGGMRDLVGVFLHYDEGPERRVEVKTSFRVIGAERDHEGSLSENWDVIQKGESKGRYLIKRCLTSERFGFIKDDIMKISFQVHIKEPKQLLPTFQLDQDLLKMFNSGEFSDVTIKCQEKEFQCSRFILAARSEVFNLMFTTQMKEAKTGVVEIDDISPEALNAVLIFIYTGKVNEHDEKTLIEILDGANKYGLDRLKKMCEVKLIDYISDENVTKYLLLAKTFSLTDLRQEIRTFLESWNAKKLANFIVEDC